MYLGAMGAMQGQGPQEIYDRISDLLMGMQKAQWVGFQIMKMAIFVSLEISSSFCD